MVNAGALFALVLVHAEIAEDVAAGVADQAAQVNEHVVGGGVDDPVVTGSVETHQHFGDDRGFDIFSLDY